MKKTNKLRYGINATILTALFILIAIAFNVIAGVFVTKFPNVKIDLSANKQFAISDATKNALSSLSKDVEIKVISPSDSEDPSVNEIFQRYKAISNKITYNYYNPTKDPTVLQKYPTEEVSSLNCLIIESGDRFEIINGFEFTGQTGNFEEAESLLTNGIISVTSDLRQTIYAVNNHGEKTFNTVKEIAEKKFFAYEELNLVNGIPDNCNLLLIAGPQTDFTDKELVMIDEFAKKGGNLKIFLDPLAPYHANLFEYISEWGVEIKNEVVKETDKSSIIDRFNGYLAVFNSSDFSKTMKTKIVYPPSYKLDILYNEINNVTITPLLTSTENATTITNNVDNGVMASHNLAVMISKVINDNGDQSKMFISGSSLRMEETFANQLVDNADFEKDILSSMLKSSSMIEISTKTLELKPLSMTVTQVLFLIIVLGVISLIIIIFGILVWRKRRFL